ncbi:BPI fold-containing family B member 6 isoform X2 [Alligator sinensis]|uniref:BPI fold-containing family B member 6 isoform X2 n=1 Tax=Alligator sinensis TaxID=38654 RepID=A0A3Q0H7F8_ALLSI|nr:BPI fold-containing family B member 6 isoform X2 [Alligator sinensis]
MPTPTLRFTRMFTYKGRREQGGCRLWRVPSRSCTRGAPVKACSLPAGTSRAMPELPRSGICCVFFLCGWLVSSHGTDAPGAVLEIDIETIDQAVTTAMAESNVLQKLAEAASKKQPGVKPIKGITGLKVKDLQPPEISLTFVPGTGLFMAVLTKITIAGRSFIGGNMEISLVANMTAKNKLSQADSGSPKFSVENCQIAIVSVKTNLPSSMLPKMVNKFLDSTLQKVMPGMLCPAVGAVLGLMNAKFDTMMAKIPFGALGSIQFTLLSPPIISQDFIELHLKPILQHQGGDPVDLPADPPALASLPPKTEPGTQIVLSANLLAGELTLLQASFDLNVTDNPALELPPLTTATLASLLPEVSESLPPSKPLVIELRVTKPPLVTIKEDKSLLHLFTTMEFLSGDPSDSRDPLFVLETHINLDTQFSVHEEKLHISVTLDRLYKMELSSSSVGPFDETPLKGFLADIIQVAYVPALNAALQEGMPLPYLFGLKYSHTEIRMSEGALVLNVRVK